MLWDGWLASLTGDDVMLLVFLIIVADRDGVSYWRKDRACAMLAISEEQFHKARERLLHLGLVAFEPFRHGDVDGFYQVLSVPKCRML